MRSADRDSQDYNLVGSLDCFAKTAGSHDSVDSILTHVHVPLILSTARCRHKLQKEGIKVESEKIEQIDYVPGYVIEYYLTYLTMTSLHVSFSFLILKS